MKLSTEFYDQLNSIENFKELDYNDPQVVAVRMRADHELTAMENNRVKEAKRIKRIEERRKVIYKFYQGRKCIAVGTSREIAEKLNIRASSVENMSFPSYHKKVNKHKHRYSKKVGTVE